MHLLDYLIYQLRPFGLPDLRPVTPEPPPDLELTASPWFAPNENFTSSKLNTNETNANLTTYLNNDTNILNFNSER